MDHSEPTVDDISLAVSRLNFDPTSAHDQKTHPPNDSTEESIDLAADDDVEVLSTHSTKVETAFELMGSEMLDLLREIRGSICGPTKDEVSKSASETTVKADPETLVVPKRRSRLWPFKRAVSNPKVEPPKNEPFKDWSGLLDFVAYLVNHIVAAHVNGESQEAFEKSRPPLFWLLNSGYSILKTLASQVLPSEASSSSLNSMVTDVSPGPLIRWTRQVQISFATHHYMQQPKNTEDVADSLQVSPLQRLIPVQMLSGIPGHKFCHVVDFAQWSPSGLPPPKEKSIGRLQCLYLFRSKKAPFYHEYMVAGFGHDDPAEPAQAQAGITNWIRLERGARTKAASLVPQADSSNPALTGVASLDKVTFSSSKATLCPNSNELAAILLPPDSLHVFIRAIIQQAMSTANSNSLYQLFTANCRWYSRRGFLNVLLWCEHVNAPYVLSWKRKPATRAQVESKLKAERFGGSSLGDKRAKGLDHRTLLNLELSRHDWGFTPPSDIHVLDPYLEALERSEETDPEEKAVLKADLLTKRSHFSFHLDDAPQALRDAEEAVALLRPLRKDAFRRDEQLVWSLHTLGTALRKCGRAEEAIGPLREAIVLDDTPNSYLTALRRGELAYTLRDLGEGRNEEVLVELEGALRILKRGDQKMEWNDHHLGERVGLMTLYAETLDDLKRHAESLEVRREIVALSRDLMIDPSESKSKSSKDTFPFASRRLLNGLVHLASTAHSADEDAEAVKAAEEGLVMCRERGYDKYGDLLQTLGLLKTYAEALDDRAGTIRAYEEALSIIREHHTDGPDSDLLESFILPLSLHYFAADDHASCGAVFDDLLRIKRKRWTEDPTSERRDALCSMLTARAGLHRRMGQEEECFKTFEEAADLVTVPAFEASVWKQKAEVLEAYASALLEFGRDERLVDILGECVATHRALFSNSPSDKKTKDGLQKALIRLSSAQTKLGNHEEALRLTSQAEELGSGETGAVADEGVVSSLFHKMMAQVRTGSPEQALKTARQAIELCETHLPGNVDYLSLAHSSCARALRECGRPGDAAEQQEISIAMLRTLEHVKNLSSGDWNDSMMKRLAKLAEYLQEADLCELALLAITEALELHRPKWEREELASIKSREYDEVGQEMCQCHSRRASILYALGRRDEGAAHLKQEMKILRAVLIDHAGASPLSLLRIANRHREEAVMHAMKKNLEDSIDAARQFLHIAQLAILENEEEFDSEELEGDGSDNGFLGPPVGTLDEVFKSFAVLATMAEKEEDAKEAMFKSFVLAHPEYFEGLGLGHEEENKNGDSEDDEASSSGE